MFLFFAAFPDDVPVPVKLTAFNNRTFEFETLTPPTSWFLKRAKKVRHARTDEERAALRRPAMLLLSRGGEVLVRAAGREEEEVVVRVDDGQLGFEHVLDDLRRPLDLRPGLVRPQLGFLRVHASRAGRRARRSATRCRRRERDDGS